MIEYTTEERNRRIVEKFRDGNFDIASIAKSFGVSQLQVVRIFLENNPCGIAAIPVSLPLEYKGRSLKTDQEVYAEAVKISQLLVGLDIATAKYVLQTCGEIICSTIVITADDAVAIDAKFRAAYEK